MSLTVGLSTFYFLTAVRCDHRPPCLPHHVGYTLSLGARVSPSCLMLFLSGLLPQQSKGATTAVSGKCFTFLRLCSFIGVLGSALALVSQAVLLS